MKMKIELTADEMQNVIDAICDEAIDRGFDPVEDEEMFNDLIAIVDAALDAMGIEYDATYDEEDDEDCRTSCPYDCNCTHCPYDEDEDEEEEDMESIIYDCGGHRGISADDARLLMKCVAKVMHRQFGYLSEEVVEFLTHKETLRIAEEWGIEVVDVGDE